MDRPPPFEPLPAERAALRRRAVRDGLIISGWLATIFVLIVVKSYQDRVVRGWSRAVRLANVGLMQMLFLDGECQ